MANWEYTQYIIRTSSGGGYHTISSYVNETATGDTPYDNLSQWQVASELGKQGWELISYTHIVNDRTGIIDELQTLWFKRQIE